MDSPIESDIINESSSEEELIKNVKPKRIMSEKQLENLKKAREIAKIKLNLKKKESDAIKKKNNELKLLQKLEKNLSIDKQLDELKKKVIKPKEPEPEPEQKQEPGEIELETVYIKKPKTKPKKKKIIYISESDDESDEEQIIYKKKSNRTPKKQNEVLQNITINDVKKNDEDLLLQRKYNEKIENVRREFLINQLFPK
jgi:hypothetical protein